MQLILDMASELSQKLYKSASIKISPIIEMNPQGLMSLREMLTTKSHCQQFIALMMGLPVFALSIKAMILCDQPQRDGTVLKGVEKDVIVYLSQTEQRPFKELEANLIFPLSVLKDRFPKLLANWFNGMKILLPVCEVYFSMFKTSSIYIQSRFLHLSQAVEGFHRATIGGSYVPAASYEPIYQAIVRAIPNGISSDLRGKLKSQIEFGNEPSLRKRLKTLVGQLSKEERAVICENANHFVEAVVSTRNNMTHLDEKGKNNLILEDHDLFYAANKLELLMALLLMKYIGLPADEILKRLTEYRRFDLTPFVLPPSLVKKLKSKAKPNGSSKSRATESMN